MNKVYYDTEFLEGSQTRRILGIPFGKTKPTIDLISIGMVREDGQEYYAISKDFNLWEAWNRYDLKEKWIKLDDLGNEALVKTKVYWIRENVLKPIYYEWIGKDINFHEVNNFTYKNFKKMLLKYGKSNKVIASDIKIFCTTKRTVIGDEFTGYVKDEYYKEGVELYGYYSSYDHVVLSWLFGKMIDLPSVFPMYTKDLKQILDKKQNIRDVIDKEHNEHSLRIMKDLGVLPTIKLVRDIKKHPNYPKNKNEHSAIADARWNKRLHEFLETYYTKD